MRMFVKILICYINIFTQKEYNSIEETYMVSEPELDQNMYLNI